MTQASGRAPVGRDDRAATGTTAVPPLARRIPPRTVTAMLATAARAPSVHNTQPWRFVVRTHAIDLYADPARKLRYDRAGREMLISCGAALFGLRLAVRELGYLPAVSLFPDPSRIGLLARVTLGAQAPVTALERQMLAALPYRHTHRGAFDPGEVPGSLLAGLQHDALAEGASLALIDSPSRYAKLAALAAEATRMQALNPAARGEIERWSRAPGRPARDGVPAAAFAPAGAVSPGRLAQRDFDLGRHFALLPGPGPHEPPPAATAVLVTSGDGRADWLRAGQALHRILVHAATVWVSASLHTQPLEVPVIRDLIRARPAAAGGSADADAVRARAQWHVLAPPAGAGPADLAALPATGGPNVPWIRATPPWLPRARLSRLRTSGHEVTGHGSHNDSSGGQTAPVAGPAGEVVRMRARVGDRLVVGENRIGEVVGVPSADGSPPYIIKWLKDGHIAMVLPDQYSRIIPAEETGTGGSGAAA